MQSEHTLSQLEFKLGLIIPFSVVLCIKTLTLSKQLVKNNEEFLSLEDLLSLNSYQIQWLIILLWNNCINNSNNKTEKKINKYKMNNINFNSIGNNNMKYYYYY